MTKDILLRVKAQMLGIQAEDFVTEQVSGQEQQYRGRAEVYVTEDAFKDFKKKGIPVEAVYQSDAEGRITRPELLEKRVCDPESGSVRQKDPAGRVEKGLIKKLEYRKSQPYGVTPRNAGQYFLQEALMQPAEKAPLVIVKGMAGTSKNLLLSGGCLGKASEQSHRGNTGGS